MALALSHIQLFLALKDQGTLSDTNVESMMELGEQNWFGDVHPSELKPLIEKYLTGEEKSILLAKLEKTLQDKNNKHVFFDIAKIFYQIIFDYKKYAAIDLHGTEIALQHDLNTALPEHKKYDLVTNIGTGEHIFNQYQFFKTVHELTKPGGLMIHALPNQGCFDHGFYNYHPTFVFDLCSANNYESLGVLYCDNSIKPAGITNIDRISYVQLAVEGKLSNYSGILTVLRRPTEDAEFKTPQQGYYNNTLPPELAKAWSKLDR